MKKRFRKRDWLDTGISALREQGIDALTVDRLCEQAGRTKGSFYFHFTAIEDFLLELTDWWVSEFTHRIIDQTSDISFGSLE